MAQAIVHIGFHKTATTWFQKSVYPHVRNLAYVPRERVNHALLDDTAFRFDPERSRAQLGLAPDRPPILCEEALSGSLLGGGMMGFQSAALAQRIRALFPNAQIVAFVRSQPEMIAAAYLQYVRNGGTHGPHRFMWPNDYAYAGSALERHEASFSLDHFEYDRLISHYASLFGAGNVHVFAYEDLQRDGRAFLERFAKTLGLELDVAALSMDKRNASYGLAVSRVARVLNHFTAHHVGDKRVLLHVPHWYRLRKRLLERINSRSALGARPTPDRVLGAGSVRWIRERYWDSNRRLADLTGLDLRGYGYPFDPPAVPAPRPSGGLAQRWLSL